MIFSPKEPGESAKEGYFEEGEARWVKREESMICTCRGEEVGVVAQLWKLVLISMSNLAETGKGDGFELGRSDCDG